MDQTTSSYLLGLISLLAAVCVYLHIKVFSYWSSRGIDGPRPWPIFGTNIYYLLGNKLEVDTKWRHQYGKTYGLYEGYSPLLRTTDNEVLKQIYVKRFSSFTDRHNEFIYGRVQRNWLLWSEGDRWVNQRALVSPMFSSSKMRQMLSSMTSCVDRFLDQVQLRLKGKAQEQAPIFQKRDLSNMTLDVIASTFFGLKLDTYSEESKRNEFLVQALEFTRLSLGRFLSWLVMPRKLARFLSFDLVPYKKYKYFDLLTKRIIEERRGKQANGKTTATSNTNKDFVQLFLDAKLPESYEQVFGAEDDREAHYNDECKHEQLERVQREQTSKAKLFKKFSDLEIRGQMSFMFLAGFETTATTIAMCVFELAHQPESQARLYKELEANFGAEILAKLSSGDRGSRTSALTQEHYSIIINLQLLDAFVSETLRLYSPLVEHNRRATEPVELTIWNSKGQERHLWLPKGLPVSTNGFVLQRDSDLFERANEFQLERFLPENRDKIKTCSFMPFGLGPRHCAGMRFALLEVKLALVKLLASYVISPGPKSRAYPPKFQQNPIFLLLEHTDFQLAPRGS